MVQKQGQFGQLLAEGQQLEQGKQLLDKQAQLFDKQAQLFEQWVQQVRAQSFQFWWTLTPWHSVLVFHQILRRLEGIWQMLLKREKKTGYNHFKKKLTSLC